MFKNEDFRLPATDEGHIASELYNRQMCLFDRP